MNDDIELSYQVYSDFKDSNWYVYWDKDYAYIKDAQLLVIWHAKADACVYYDYSHLKPHLKDGTFFKSLSQIAQSIPQSDMDELVKIANEFIADMDVEFDT